jgi:hypothetical protein
MNEMHVQHSNDRQAHTANRGAESPPPICVSLEICDDSPAPERRIPTIVIRERKSEVMVVDDAMIIGEPTLPWIELAPEPEPAPIKKHRPLAAFLVCFCVSALGSAWFASRSAEPPQMTAAPAPAPDPPPIVQVPKIEQPRPKTVARARVAKINPVQRRAERKWDPLRTRIIFRASDI